MIKKNDNLDVPHLPFERGDIELMKKNIRRALDDRNFLIGCMEDSFNYAINNLSEKAFVQRLEAIIDNNLEKDLLSSKYQKRKCLKFAESLWEYFWIKLLM